MKSKIFRYILCFLCLPCYSQTKEQYLERVEELKTMIEAKYWPSFNDEKYFIPIDYHEDGAFVMNMSINGGMESAVMHCSSPEMTLKSIPGTTGINDWYAMLLHECFHGFQFKHPAFYEYCSVVFENNEISTDSLVMLKAKYPWYEELIDKENALLVQAYETEAKEDMLGAFRQFSDAREKRFNEVRERLGLDMSSFYPLMETYEGTARYIEYCLAKESCTDTSWMFNLDSDKPYYASGLYITLILDKWNIAYKDQLFDTIFNISELVEPK